MAWYSYDWLGWSPVDFPKKDLWKFKYILQLVHVRPRLNWMGTNSFQIWKNICSHHWTSRMSRVRKIDKHSLPSLLRLVSQDCPKSKLSSSLTSLGSCGFVLVGLTKGSVALQMTYGAPSFVWYTTVEPRFGIGFFMPVVVALAHIVNNLLHTVVVTKWSCSGVGVEIANKVFDSIGHCRRPRVVMMCFRAFIIVASRNDAEQVKWRVRGSTDLPQVPKSAWRDWRTTGFPDASWMLTWHCRDWRDWLRIKLIQWTKLAGCSW